MSRFTGDQNARTRRRLRARRGFTVAETLAAIVVVTLGLLGSAGLMASSIRHQRLASTRSEMTVLAENKIDELRMIGMTVTTDPLRSQLAVGGSMTSSLAGYADSVDAGDGVSYRRTWEIATDASGGRRLTVRVEPRVIGNYRWSRLELTTLIAF